MTHCKESGRHPLCKLSILSKHTSQRHEHSVQHSPFETKWSSFIFKPYNQEYNIQNFFFSYKPVTQLNLYFELAFPFIMDVKRPQVLCSYSHGGEIHFCICFPHHSQESCFSKENRYFYNHHQMILSRTLGYQDPIWNLFLGLLDLNYSSVFSLG